jgi:hypothetical protein
MSVAINSFANNVGKLGLDILKPSMLLENISVQSV